MTLPPQWVAAAGAAPALVAMWYFDRLDRAPPEPAGLRRKVAAFGGISVIPALILGWNEGGRRRERSRRGHLRGSLVWRRSELDERMDGIVYATRAGLGFALWTGMMGYMAAVIAMSWIIIMPMARTALRLDDADQVRRGR